jgi:hypothetical protein
MKNPKIENCTIRIRAIAEPYGFKTLKSFHKFLLQCKPDAKLYYGMTSIRIADALKYVEKE